MGLYDNNGLHGLRSDHPIQVYIDEGKCFN